MLYIDPLCSLDYDYSREMFSTRSRIKGIIKVWKILKPENWFKKNKSFLRLDLRMEKRIYRK